MKTTVRTRILCGIFGFYLTLAFLIPQLLLVVHTYLLNGNEMLDRICTVENAEKARENIVTACEEIADPCEIPLSVYDDIFTTAAVAKDMRIGLEKALAFESYKPDTSDMQTRLAENVRAVLREQLAVEEVDKSEKDITTFCKESMKYYNKYVYLTAYHHFRTLASAINKFARVALIVFAALLVIGLFFLIRLLRRFGPVLRECSYAIFASGACNALIALYLKKENLFADLQMTPIYFRDAIRSFLNGAINADITFGLLTVAIGLLLFAGSVIVDTVKNGKLKKAQQAESTVQAE